MKVAGQSEFNLATDSVSSISELPEGWTEARLDEILQSIESGSRPKGGVRGIKTGYQVLEANTSTKRVDSDLIQLSLCR